MADIFTLGSDLKTQTELSSKQTHRQTDRQTRGGRLPQKNKRWVVCDLVNLQVSDLLPGPGFTLTHPRGPPHVLLPRGVYQHHIKLCAQGVH